MKRLIAGIVIGLVLGAFIGYQLTPTPDIADYARAAGHLQESR